MLRFSLLGSGSNGNAVFVASPSCKVLIDAGFSLKQTQSRVQEIGERLDGVNAIFVTHEHADHVAGLGVLARSLGVPVYVTDKTRDRLPRSVGALPHVEAMEPGESVTINGLTLTSFSVCHDAVDPVGYIVEHDGIKLGLASDLGRISQLVRVRLERSHGLILESNYCPDMLRQGRYPAALQQRIRGSHGHLSNSDSSSLLASLLHDDLRIVVLVHLSEENNCPELARDMAARVLSHHRAELHVASRHGPTPLFSLEL